MMDTQIKVSGRKICEPVCGRLVGYPEGIAKIFNREVPIALCLLQKIDRTCLRE